MKAKPDGTSAVALTSTLELDDGDPKLDQGETLACCEGAVFWKDVVGQENEVEPFAQIDGKVERVGAATWKP